MSTAKRPLTQKFCQFALRLRIKRIIYMQKLPRLVAKCLNHLRMTMPYPTDSPAGKHIQYLFALVVEQIAALALDDNPLQPAVIGYHILIKQFYRFLRRHNSSHIR